jgi:hypothetical protein
MSRTLNSTRRRLDGGIDLTTNPRKLQELEGPMRSPDCLNVFGLGGSILSRNGCGHWVDTGTVPIKYFSYFSPLTLAEAGLLTIAASGAVNTLTNLASAPSPRRIIKRAKQRVGRVAITAPTSGTNDIDPDDCTVEWTGFSEATGYKVQVLTMNGAEVWSSAVSKDMFSKNVDAGKMVGGTAYVIRVSGYINNVVKSVANVMIATRLTAPMNLAPNAAIAELTPTLSCGAVNGATGYTFYVYDSNGNPIYASDEQAEPSFQLPNGLLEDGKSYSFKVKASNAVTSATSAAQAFNVALPHVGTPTNLRPSGETDIVSLECDETPNALGYVFKLYKNGAVIYTSGELSEPSCSEAAGYMEDLEEYTFTVTAVRGLESRTSDAQAFSVYVPLEKPTDLRPSGHSYNPKPTELSFGFLINKAKSYTFRLYLRFGEEPIWQGTSTTTSVALPENLLQDDTDYAFTVTAEDGDHKALSEKCDFYTYPPPLPVWDVVCWKHDFASPDCVGEFTSTPTIMRFPMEGDELAYEWNTCVDGSKYSKISGPYNTEQEALENVPQECPS